MKIFTVLEIWKQKGFPYVPFLLKVVGINIACSYIARYGKKPEKVEIFEEGSGKTFTVNQYPEDFRKEANKALNRLQKRHKSLLPRSEPKKKRTRVKRPVKVKL